MGRVHIQIKPTQVDEVYKDWDELYESISSDWQGKAQRMMARRQRKLKREMI